jgi:DNA-binding GntR family transcriptional regulator
MADPLRDIIATGAPAVDPPGTPDGPVLRFVDPGLIRDRVVDALRDAIVSGRLRPGERIREREIVAALQVSRSPLREAIRILETEGLVTTVAHRGACVSELTREDLRLTTEVRVMVETFAVRLAAARLPDATLEAMGRHLEAARRRGLDPHAAEDLDHSLTFHDAFVRACGNPKLVQLHEVVKRHMRRYQLVAFSRLGRADRATAEHAEILEAFRRRDAAAVERLLVSHLQRVSDEIAPHLAASPADPGHPTHRGRGTP